MNSHDGMSDEIHLPAPTSGKKSFSPHTIPKTKLLDESPLFQLCSLKGINCSCMASMICKPQWSSV